MAVDTHRIDITENIRIRLWACDGCLKHKFIGYWNKIVIRDDAQPARIYFACSSRCQLLVLQADDRAYLEQ